MQGGQQPFNAFHYPCFYSACSKQLHPSFSSVAEHKVDNTGNKLSAVSMPLCDSCHQCPAGLRTETDVLVCNFIISQCVILTAEWCHRGKANWICVMCVLQSAVGLSAW